MSERYLPRVRLWPLSPFAFSFGGFERQCSETLAALRQLNLDARWLSPTDRRDPFDVLHLFGPPLDAAAVVTALEGRRLVVSTLSGAGTLGRAKNVARLATASALSRLRLDTTYALRRRTLETASAVVCVNDFEREYFRQVYRLDTGKIHVVPNGVDAPFWAPGQGFAAKFGVHNYVLFVGTICPRKNPLLLAQAMSTTSTETVFIGPLSTDVRDAWYVDMFQSTVKRHPHLHHIEELTADRPLLASAMGEAELLCLPSEAETQPLVAMEAMAGGTPAALARRPYAAREPFAQLPRVRIDSVDHLRADVLATLTRPRSAATRLGPEYTWASTARKLLELYDHR